MQNITDSWFVQGMIKATSDAWLKGWDERNGGGGGPHSVGLNPRRGTHL